MEVMIHLCWPNCGLATEVMAILDTLHIEVMTVTMAMTKMTTTTVTIMDALHIRRTVADTGRVMVMTTTMTTSS
jgi:hypothetical protein